MIGPGLPLSMRALDAAISFPTISIGFMKRISILSYLFGHETRHDDE
jgi:hypothetical protein